MNMFKKNGGFTLVELIVVIAILAILAGVAVPAYSGYITKAQDAAALTELDAIVTAASAAHATDTDAVTKITVSADGKTIKVYLGDTPTECTEATHGTDFKVFYTNTPDLSDTSYKTGATWTSTSGDWEAGVK